MTDSEAESSSSDSSSNHDSMSVSDQEGDSREDEMPSADHGVTNKVTHQPEVDMDSTASNSLSSDEQAAAAAESLIPSHDVASAVIVSISDQNQASASIFTRVPTVDLDDAAALDLMSKSYSEIVQSPSRFKIEPVTESEEAMLHQEGTVLKEGDMVHFIAKNLETKIRLSSPDISEASQSIRKAQQQQQLTGAPKLESLEKSISPSSLIDTSLLAQLEREARCIAASVDGLTEHLTMSLHTISAVTAQSVAVYKDSVCKTCDAMDGNIKSMYQLMAKCEELSKSMTPIYKQAEQVKEIKRLLDRIDNTP